MPNSSEWPTWVKVLIATSALGGTNALTGTVSEIRGREATEVQCVDVGTVQKNCCEAHNACLADLRKLSLECRPR